MSCSQSENTGSGTFFSLAVSPRIPRARAHSNAPDRNGAAAMARLPEAANEPRRPVLTQTSIPPLGRW